LQANFYSQGQVCSNGTRVFLHENVYQTIKTKLIDAVDQIKVEDPLEDQTRFGALVSKQHLEKVQGFISRAISEGGKIVSSSRNIETDLGGYYMRPVVMECHDHMEMTKAEHFGPICQIYKFKTEEEVLRRANDSNLGLAAGVFTNDFHRVDRFIENFEAGTLYVNWNGFPGCPDVSTYTSSFINLET